jgi:fructokinase
VTLYGAVEIGGTKTDVAVGTCPADMSEPLRLATASPVDTLGAIERFFDDHDVAAVGVASFGPIDLDPDSRNYGSIRSTPKPGWSGFDLYHSLQDGVSAPVVIDTDVNGAALGEGAWGAASGMSNYAYVTVGTGIGAGVVVDGALIGDKSHPEMGHIPTRRLANDTHDGTCPYHGDCLEGMAAGPALEARFGSYPTWAGRDEVLHLAAHYVAQGLLALLYIASPERMIVGGGVASMPGFHDRLRYELGELAANYPDPLDLDLAVSKPGLGDRSGIAGAFVLAASASD